MESKLGGYMTLKETKNNTVGKLGSYTTILLIMIGLVFFICMMNASVAEEDVSLIEEYGCSVSPAYIHNETFQNLTFTISSYEEQGCWINLTNLTIELPENYTFTNNVNLTSLGHTSNWTATNTSRNISWVNNSDHNVTLNATETFTINVTTTDSLGAASFNVRIQYDVSNPEGENSGDQNITFNMYTTTNFSYTGYIYNRTGSPIDGGVAEVTVTAMGQDSMASFGSFSNTSNETGFFNITNIPILQDWSTADTNPSGGMGQGLFYRIAAYEYNDSSHNYAINTSRTLPDLPASELKHYLPSPEFYLIPAITFNVTAEGQIYSHEGPPSYGDKNFSLNVKDQDLGYSVAEFDTSTNYHLFSVPAGRNYSLSIYPNEAFPMSIRFNNISNWCEDSIGSFQEWDVVGVKPGVNSSCMQYNGTYLINITVNTTSTPKNLTGNFTGIPGGALSNMSIVAYTMETEDIVYEGYPLPYNIGALNSPIWTQYNDTYNLTDHNFSIKLPATMANSYLMLRAYAKNDTTGIYYMGTNFTNASNQNLNVTDMNFTMEPLINGSLHSISSNNISDNWNNTVLANTTTVTFRLINETYNHLDTLNVFVEVTRERWDGSPYKTMIDGQNGVFNLSLVNGSGIDKLTIYSQQYAPISTPVSAEILNGTGSDNRFFNATNESGICNITLRQFGQFDPLGENNAIQMNMYLSNESCNIPNPPESYALFDTDQGEGQFSPLNAILKGDVNMMITAGNATVYYINVDLLASGPPDAAFTDEGEQEEFSALWKFGSQGPEIYDYVLIGVNYTGMPFEDKNEIYLNFPYLYDNEFNEIWNQSKGHGIAEINNWENLSDYNDYLNSPYESYLNGTGVFCDPNDPTLSNGIAYDDEQNTTIWMKIPHFSGLGGELTGSGGPPVLSNEYPTNQTTDISLNQATINVTIVDDEGDAFNWSIETSPNIGSNSSNGDVNGSKEVNISGNLSYGITYTWWVNATDGNDSVNATYSFTAENAPTEYYVDDDADSSWYNFSHVRTIQEGIDNASAGNTVYVWDGTYTENVVVNKSVTIEANSSAVLDGLGTGNGLQITVSNVTVQNLTVTDCSSGNHDSPSSGIYLYNSTNTIENVTLTNITVNNSQLGVYTVGVTQSNISQCNLSNNTLIGLYFVNTDYTNLTNSEVNNSGHTATYLENSSNYNISGNYMCNNTFYGIYSYNSTTNNISDNTFWNNELILASSSIGGGTNYYHSSYYDHVIEDNTVNGDSLLYYKNNDTGGVLDENNPAGQIIIVNSSNFIIRNMTLNYSINLPIHIAYSDDINITNCNISSDDSMGYGIYFIKTNNSDIYSPNNISYNNIGVMLEYSYNNNITGSNQIFNNTKGIKLSNSNSNKITQAEIYNSTDGIYLSQSNYTNISSNIIHNNSGGNGVKLNSSDYNNITLSNSIRDNNYGIYLLSSNNNNISSNNEIYDNTEDGIQLASNSNNNNISSINVYDNGRHGIYLDDSDNNNISSVNVYGNSNKGIHLDSSDSNNITSSNYVYNNTNGINLWQSTGNLINSSYFYNNSQQGINLGQSDNNTVSDNQVYNNSQQGINLAWSDNNTLNSNHVNDSSQQGMYIGNSNNSNISSNYVYNNSQEGIKLDNSNNNTISANQIYNNTNDGIKLWSSSNNSIISTNHIYNNSDNGIDLSSSDNNTISSSFVYNNTGIYGINIGDSDDNIISSNNVNNNSNMGIRLWNSSNNNISSNTIDNNTKGLRIAGSGPSNHNNITSNSIYNNTNGGIYILNSSYNNISSLNQIYNNNHTGISLNSNSDYNDIIGNNLTNNAIGDGEGIYLGGDCDGNTIYNNIFNNTPSSNAVDTGNNNRWNRTGTTLGPNIIGGAYIGGNYWDNYNGLDDDGDGIGDTGTIPFGPGDNLPLASGGSSSVPTNLVASTYNRTAINLTWTKGLNADKTYIRYSDSNNISDRDAGIGSPINVTESSHNLTGLNFSTTYYFKAWSYNSSANSFSPGNITAFNTTDSNSAPSLSNTRPANNSLDESIIPTLSITVNDAHGDSMDVKFMTNESGSWTEINTNSSVNNGTYNQTDDDMNAYNNKYWWSVNVSDEYNAWTNATYCFTTTNTVFVNNTYTDATEGWEKTRFKNLTRAINNVTAVSENVTIKVDSGTYEENLTIDMPITITKNGTEKPVLDGLGLVGINVTSNHTTIQHINITNCTRGIELFGTSLHNISLQRNKFFNCTNAIFSNASFTNTTITIQNNKFLGNNITMGMNFSNAQNEVNGSLNYWGSITGANHSSNSNGTGVNVTDNVIFSPWIGENGGRIYANQLFINTTVDGSNEFNATTSAGVAKINISTSGSTTVAVAGYSSDSLPEDIPNTVRTVGGILDIEVEDESAISSWPINITMYYNTSDLANAGIGEDNLDGMYRWNTSSEAWEIYNRTGVITTDVTVEGIGYAGSCWANAWPGQLSPKAMANTNDAPNTPTGINPEDAETYVDAQPSINVTVTDDDANNMTVEFYENTTGSWILQQTNSSVTINSNVVWNSYTNATENMTTYYWSVNITDGKLWTNNTYHFTTEIIPSKPTSFTATKDGTSAIDLEWTKNSSADKTYVERASSATWTRGSGTLVDNVTGESLEDSVSAGTTYYYQAWSYNSSNNSYSILYASDSATTDSDSGGQTPGGSDPTPPPADTTETDDAPTISDVSHSPTIVTSEDTVTVSSTVTDDNTISSVILYWDDGSEQSKSMSGTDDSYTASIGPFEGLSTVSYWIEATDNASQTTESEEHSFTVEDATGPVITIVSPGSDELLYDTTPQIQATYSDVSGIDTDSVVLSLNGADTSSTVTSSFVTYTPTTSLDTGDHTVVATVSDTEGNENSKQWSFTIEESASFAEEHIDSIDSGIEETITPENAEETGITTIAFTSAVDLTDVQISVAKIDEKPEYISDEPTNAYMYLDITMKSNATVISDDDIESLTVSFKVSLDWFDDNNIDKDKVTLLRYHNDEWQTLTTSMTSEEDSFAYFEATTTGMSTFAIAGDQVEEDDTPEPTGGLPWLYIILAIIAIIIIAFVILVKTGYIYFEH